MKKSLFIILSFFLLQTTVLAEKLPEYKLGAPSFSKLNNPIFYKYITDYQNQLYNAIDENKFKYPEWGYVFFCTLHRDGSITDICDGSDLYPFEQYARETVLNTPPPPFPKEVEDDSVIIHFDFYSLDYLDSNTISYIAKDNEMWMSIAKQRLTNNPIKKFLYYHGFLRD